MYLMIMILVSVDKVSLHLGGIFGFYWDTCDSVTFPDPDYDLGPLKGFGSSTCFFMLEPSEFMQSSSGVDSGFQIQTNG